MPYTEASLPFASGLTPQSRHASHEGAVEAAPRAANQQVRYMQLLKDRPMHGLTDLESAKLLGIERTSVTARRVPLVKAGLVVPCGYRPGPTGVRNVCWKLA